MRQSRYARISAALLTCSLAASHPAAAQTSFPVPGNSASQISGPAKLEDQRPPAPDEMADDGTVKHVSHFEVDGNTLLKDVQIRKILKDYEGKDLTLKQMKDAARYLTALYQRNGYYLVRVIVPAQSFAGDEVKMRVIEGKIGTVKVEGNRHWRTDFLQRRFALSTRSGNFKNQDFVRAMLLLNELPDLRVRAVLMPSATPGTTDVVLKVEDNSTLHFGVDYNNYGTSQTGQQRVGFNGDYGNLVTQADRISLLGVLGFPTNTGNAFFQANYSAPVNDRGTMVSGSYANGAFDVSEGLGAILDIRGTANIYTVAVSQPLDRNLDFSSNLGLSVSHKNIRNTFFGDALPFSRDEYTDARLTYQGDWRSASGRTILQASWTQGLGGNSNGPDPLTSRAGAGGTFAHFNLDIGRIQNLRDNLYGVLRATAQVSTSPLYVAEQYAMGGPDTVRGYPQAALLGDNAYLISAELRWSPIKSLHDKFQTVAFFDHGGVTENRQVAGDLPYGNNLTGAGFGFRYSLSQASNVRVDVGFPIKPTDNGLGNGPAVYAGVQTRF